MIAAIVIGWILRPQNGALNQMLEAVGLGALQHNWLGDPDTALPSIMVIMIWVQLGYPIVIFMAALQRVDPELYEAAELDGANWFQRFRAITVGIIRPEIFVVTLTCTIAALKVFGPIYALTGGGPGTATIVPAYYAYSEFFQSQQVGYGATIATALTIVIAAVSVRVHPRAEPRRAEGGGRDERRTRRDRPPPSRHPSPSRSPPRPRPRRRPAARRPATGWCCSWRSLLGLLIAVPFLLILINSFKSPADYNTVGPADPADRRSTSTASSTFWERVDFPQKLWNSVFISGARRGARRGCSRCSTRSRSASAG